MIHVEIEEIANGFTVALFDSEGASELDKKVFAKTFDDVLRELVQWYKAEKEGEK